MKFLHINNPKSENNDEIENKNLLNVMSDEELKISDNSDEYSYSNASVFIQ